MTLLSTWKAHNVARKILIRLCRFWLYIINKDSHFKVTNYGKWHKIYNNIIKRVIALISVNIVPRCDMYGRSQACIIPCYRIIITFHCITYYRALNHRIIIAIYRNRSRFIEFYCALIKLVIVFCRISYYSVKNPAPRERSWFLGYKNISIPFKCEMKLCLYQLPFSSEKISDAWQEKRGTCGQNWKCKCIHQQTSLNKKHKKHYQSWWIVHNIIALYAPSWQK